MLMDAASTLLLDESKKISFSTSIADRILQSW